jgi:dihydrofolate reductase
MRKVTMLNRISLDGFYAGPNGEIDWFIHDPEVDQAAHEMMKPDTLLFGRLTYQMFESYWPPIASDSNAPEEARTLSNELNQMTKVVFSTTLDEATWVNSNLIKGEITKLVRELKQGQGEDITIFGSGSIVQQLAKAGLMDEYLVILTPVILGTGKPLFEGINKQGLRLIDSRVFNSGNLLLHYQTAK